MEGSAVLTVAIFGAGKYGAQALGKYGPKQVICFIDNDAAKWGSVYHGKPVVSLSSFLAKKSSARIVVALNQYKAIAEQLRNQNLYDYDYFIPYMEDAMLEFEMAYQQAGGKIILFGQDEMTEILLQRLRFMREAAMPMKVLEKDDGALLRESDDVVFVSAPSRAYALQAYLEREFPQKRVVNPFVQKTYIIKDKFLFRAYDDAPMEVDEEHYVEESKKVVDNAALYEYMEELWKDLPLFNHIEVETINRCNGSCDFCPVSVGRDRRFPQKMDTQLYKKIVDELCEMQYAGKFAPFSNNEPFLDVRIIELTKYARIKLPKARIHMFTNGTLLDVDTFSELMEYLDEMYIDNYNVDMELIPSVKRIAAYCNLHEEWKSKVTICIRSPREIRTSRGGDAPNRTRQKLIPDACCVLPFRQMIVRPDGKVSLCCNDPYGKYTLGDLTRESLLEVWYGKKFNSVREAMLRGRSAWGDCGYCDTVLY